MDANTITETKDIILLQRENHLKVFLLLRLILSIILLYLQKKKFN